MARIAHSPTPDRRGGMPRSRWEVDPGFTHHYSARGHSRFMYENAPEVAYIDSDASDRFWCSSCRRRQA